MKFDKERRDEVIKVFSMLRGREIAEEQAEQMLASFSPQLVAEVRTMYDKGWKPSFKVENQVRNQVRPAVAAGTRALQFTVPLVGGYTVFAAVTHLLSYLPSAFIAAHLPAAGAPVLGRYVFGLLGVICGLIMIRLLKTGILLSALWLAGAGFLFHLWAAPLLLSAVVVLVLILECVLKITYRLPLITVCGVSFMAAAAALIVSAFYSGTVAALQNAAAKIEAVPVQSPVAVLVGTGIVLAVAGLVMILAGAKKAQ